MSDESTPVSEVQDVPKAARRGRPTLAQMTAGQDPVALEREMEEDRRLALVEKQYGDDLPFDQHRLENEIVFYFKQSANAYFEAGRRLVRLKEHVGHGAFMTSLERIGLEYEVAKKTMFTVRKFIEANAAKEEAFTTLSPSKLYEVALLDSSDIEELAAGGTVAGKTVDDLEKMTVREIKETFRREREDRKAKDAAREDAIAKKEEMINKLERELRGTPDRSLREKAGIELWDWKARFTVRCQELIATMDLMEEILNATTLIPDVSLEQIRAFADELVDGGTAGVFTRWEALTELINGLRPAGEEESVRRLG